MPELAAAREELGLPEDADPTPVVSDPGDGYDPGTPEGDLLDAAILSVPSVRIYAQTFAATPLLRALDGAAITAAAADIAGSPTAAAAIQTSQSFDDLAGELAGDGYERDGDAISNPDEPISDIVDAGDGVWVMGGEDADPGPQELVDPPPGGPQGLSELLRTSD